MCPRSTCSNGLHAGHDCRARSCEHIVVMMSLCQIHMSRYQDRQVISSVGCLTWPCQDQPSYHQAPKCVPTCSSSVPIPRYQESESAGDETKLVKSTLSSALRNIAKQDCKLICKCLPTHLSINLPNVRAPSEAKVGTSVINGSRSARAADLHAFRPMTEFLHKPADHR